MFCSARQISQVNGVQQAGGDPPPPERETREKPYAKMYIGGKVRVRDGYACHFCCSSWVVEVFHSARACGARHAHRGWWGVGVNRVYEGTNALKESLRDV